MICRAGWLGHGDQLYRPTLMKLSQQRKTARLFGINNAGVGEIVRLYVCSEGWGVESRQEFVAFGQCGSLSPDCFSSHETSLTSPAVP